MKIFILFALLSVSLGGDNIVNLANGNPRLTMSLFKEFQHDYGRNYPPSEQKMRYALFKKSIERTAKWNAEEPSVTYGLTPFSGLTEAERDNMMGLNASAIAHGDDAPQADVNRPIVGNANHVPLYAGIKDQGQTSACWAFAATAVLEGWMSERNGRQYTALSDQETADCTDGSTIANGGVPFFAFQAIQRQNHLTTEANHPFTSVDGQCNAAMGFRNALPFRITRVIDIRGDNDQANFLRREGPVVACLRFDERLQELRGGIFENPSCNNVRVNHAVTIVGYNNRAWTIRNSYGANWGEAGYGRITRGTANMCNISGASSSIRIGRQEKEE